MSEPDAGSDVRGMKCMAVRDGDDYVINGTKHFISHADLADYVILFAATGEEMTSKGPKKKITGFLVDFDTPGCEVVHGYNCVSNHGYHNMRVRRGERVARFHSVAGRCRLRGSCPPRARHRHGVGRHP